MYFIIGDAYRLRLRRANISSDIIDIKRIFKCYTDTVILSIIKYVQHQLVSTRGKLDKMNDYFYKRDCYYGTIKCSIARTFIIDTYMMVSKQMSTNHTYIILVLITDLVNL